MASTPPDTGSHPAASRRGGLTWLWVLLAVVLIALVAWWLLAGVGDDDEDVEASPQTAAEETEAPGDDETPGTNQTQETASTPTGAPTGAPTGEAVLVADLLVEDVDPTALLGQTVEAEDVTVQAVVADEAFFVGPDPERTVLVRLTEFAGEQESPMTVDEGDTLSFTGTVEEVDEALLSELSLGDPPQVSTGDVYIQVEQLSMSS